MPAVANRLLDLLLPPLCLSCDRPTGAGRTLCATCWSSIHFIARPFCACCGAPFEIPVDDGTLCGACIAEPPSFKSARAAMLYDDASKNIVLGFKHGDRTHLTRTLAAWMRRASEDVLGETDLILPVPLHRWRLFKRRYNQAALLAQNLAHQTGKTFLPDLLQRRRPTPPQGRMNRKARHANVKNAFGLKPDSATILKNKTVLLVDDVLTTGATVNKCSHLLLDAGAKAVNVLTLSRVKAGL